MSSADYGERGGTAAAPRAPSGVHFPVDSHHPARPTQQLSSGLDDTDFSTWSNSLESNTTTNTASTDQSPANLSSTATSNTGSSLPKFINPSLGSNLDLSTSNTVARNESLLRDAVFPQWTDDAAPSDVDNAEEMQKKDPLGTQIWKLYSRTKSRLPNQERMENLTWRMMAMNLRRREQQQQQQAATYAKRSPTSGEPKVFGTDSYASEKQVKLKRPAPPASTPSGIAQQLRKSIDKSADNEHSTSPMNLDDFIVPSSVASPAGMPTPATSETAAPSRNMEAPGIPIISRTKPQVQIPKHLPPSSVPQTAIPPHRTSEFDYVRKRVRKTSIDERRGGVSSPCHYPADLTLMICRIESDQRISLLKCPLYPVQTLRMARRWMVLYLTMPSTKHMRHTSQVNQITMLRWLCSLIHSTSRTTLS